MMKNSARPSGDNLPKLPPCCAWQDDGSVVMQLEKPLTLSGRNQDGPNALEVTELVFRDLDGGAMIDMSEYLTPGKRMAFLIGTSTGHTGPSGDKVIRSIKARDYRRAEAVIDVFTDAGLTIGTSD